MSDDDDNDDDDIDLIHRALAGDRSAATTLAHRLNRVMSARAEAFRREFSVPWPKEDMIGDVWVALLARGGHRLRMWNPKRGRKLESYVALVARGRWLNRLALTGVALTPVDPEAAAARADPEPRQDARILSADLLRKLWAHLTDVLPAKGLVVLRLVFSFGMSPDECARVVGQTRQWVDNWLFRIRTEARKFLSDSV